MTPMTRRERLISLLRQIPAAKDEELHDGRRVVPDEAIEETFAAKIEALYASDVFARLMSASAAYVTRFGGTSDFQGALRKQYEEMREYEQASALYIQSLADDRPLSLRLKSPHQLKQAMLQEFIDFMITAGGVFAALGVTLEDIEQAAHDTLAKLDSRDTTTHAWNPATKTVERIGRASPPMEDFHIHAQLQALGQVKRPMKRED